jgi:hypothetical protein
MYSAVEKWAEFKIPGRRKRLSRITRTDAPSSSRIDLLAAYDGNQFANVESAEAAILNELSEGRLTCTALRNNEGDRREVPKDNWPDLRFIEIKGDYRAVARSSNTEPWYRLLFRRKQVLALWPDPLTSKPTKRQMSPKEKKREIESAVKVLRDFYNNLDSTRPLHEDRESVTKAFGKPVVRRVVEKARKIVFEERNWEVRPGRRIKQRPTA